MKFCAYKLSLPIRVRDYAIGIYVRPMPNNAITLSLSLSLSIYIYIQTHTTTVFQFSFIDIYECTKKCCIHDTTMLQVHGYLPILVFEKEKKKSTYSCKMLHTTMLQVHDNLPILVYLQVGVDSRLAIFFSLFPFFSPNTYQKILTS